VESNAIKTEIAVTNIEKQLAQELENLKNLNQEKLLSDKQYADKVAAAEKDAANKTRALKRAQFEKEKQASILKAIISGAVAVVEAFASAGNPILGAIFAALTAGIVATQIGLISKQPVPEYAVGGYVKGESHAKGGVPIYAEGGEYIVRKSVAQKPGMNNVLNNINNGGSAFDEKMISQIVKQTINGIASIPVINVESNTTKVQRKVKNIESRSSWVLLPFILPFILLI
jgi:putative sterol carrier protein